ncbi:acyl-CoA dehydrogenase family protein [Sneathiella sp.]|jgi:alkylation response protein AidB-like acyl-CoA dehydrogenase|uniref:acyl-CoA dehydrogenase family protein n=1 Tax=Sneathiella sp. TaxID=1964365 RepID=UPI0039E6A84E
MTAFQTMINPSEDVMNIAKSFSEEIRTRASEFEAQGYVSQDLADRIAETGLYRLCTPKSLHGLEKSPVDYAAVTEYLAHADGSVAWVVFIGITSAISVSNLPDDAVRRIFLSDPKAITAGVFAPMGRAIKTVQGDRSGYRLTGQWQWGSGSRNAAFISGGGFVTDPEGAILKTPDGRPDQRAFFMPTTDIELLDTWQVSGLKATGSTDFRVRDLFVPEEMTFDATRMSGPDGAIHKFPIFALLGIGIAAVALGLARASLDELVGFASEKTPQGSSKPLALKPSTQSQVAKAEAELRAARLFFYESISRSWQNAMQGDEPSIEDRRDIRLATTHATNSAARVIDRMYRLGGGTSVYAKSPLQRHFRDVHVATQHMMVSDATLELVGRLFVGVETNTAQL